MLVHLDRMTKPVVAALNGMALGGGLELAMRAHGIVAARGASLQFPEITLGIVPGIGAMVVPYRRWPQASVTLNGMLRQARRITADEAAELGMLDACVEPGGAAARDGAGAGDRRAAAQESRHAGDAAAAGPDRAAECLGRGSALRCSRSWIVPSLRLRQRQACTRRWRSATGLFGESACTAAAREGIEAFHAGRPPDFGRTG